MKLKIRFTVTRVIFGVIFVVVHWILFGIGSAIHSELLPNPVLMVDMFLILPASAIIVPVGRAVENIFHKKDAMHINMTLGFIISTVYVFFAGMFVGFLFEEMFLGREKKYETKNQIYSG